MLGVLSANVASSTASSIRRLRPTGSADNEQRLPAAEAPSTGSCDSRLGHPWFWQRSPHGTVERVIILDTNLVEQRQRCSHLQKELATGSLNGTAECRHG